MISTGFLSRIPLVWALPWILTAGISFPALAAKDTAADKKDAPVLEQPAGTEEAETPEEPFRDSVRKVFGEQKYIREPVRVTTHPAEDFQPAVSPDGTSMAFVSDRTGNLDIWIQSLEKGSFSTPRQLTTHTAADKNPSFSPDGNQLVFVSHRSDAEGDLYLLDLKEFLKSKGNPAEPKQLTGIGTADREPVFDGTGKGVIFTSHKGSKDKDNLWRLDLENGQKTQITQEGANAPAVSRDGRYLAYVSFGQDEKGDIWVRDMRTGKAFPLTSGPEFDGFPSWSPDGRYIFFSRYGVDTNGDGIISVDDNPSIFRISFEAGGGEPSSLPVPKQLTTSETYDLFPAAWGDSVLYVSRNGGKVDIWELPSEGTIPEQKTIGEMFGQAEEIVKFYYGRKPLHLLAYQNLTQLFGNDPDRTTLAKSHFRVAQIYRDMGNRSEAEKTDRLIRDRFSDVPLYSGLSRIDLVRLDLEAHRDDDRGDFKKLAAKKVAELESIRKEYSSERRVTATAGIEIAALLATLGQTDRALGEFNLVISGYADLRDLAAEAAFRKSGLYEGIDLQDKLIQVYLNVIRDFTDVREWSHRASGEVIRLAEIPGNNVETVAALRSLVEKYKDYPILPAMAQNRIGELYYGDVEYLKAKDAYGETVSRFPKEVDLVDEALFQIAKIHVEEGEYEKSLRIYQKIAGSSEERYQTYITARTNFIRNSLEKGNKEFKEGELRLAVKSFKKLLDFDYSITDAHRGLIKSYAALNEIQKAVSFYEGNLKDHPDDAPSLYGLGLSYTYLNPPKIKEALELVQKAVEQNSLNPNYHQTLGWLYEQKEVVLKEGETMDNAIQEYQYALALNDETENPEAESDLYLNLGNANFYLKNYPEAIRYYALREKSAYPFPSPAVESVIAQRMGEAQFKVGNDKEAIRYFQKTLDLIGEGDPVRKTEVTDRLGLAYQSDRQYDRAIESFTQVLEEKRGRGDRENENLVLRNIANNFFYLSQSADRDRDPGILVKAIDSYTSSYQELDKMVEKKPEPKKGFFRIHLKNLLGGEEKTAAKGFSKEDEEKLIFQHIGNLYGDLRDYGKAIEFLEKKLALTAKDSSGEGDAAAQTERAVILNQLAYYRYLSGNREGALADYQKSLALCVRLENVFGTNANALAMSRILLETPAFGYPFPFDTPLQAIRQAVEWEEKADGRNDESLIWLHNYLGQIQFRIAQENPLEFQGKQVNAETVAQATSQWEDVSNRLNAAERHYQKALEISRGPEHDRDVTFSRYRVLTGLNLAVLYGVLEQKNQPREILDQLRSTASAAMLEDEVWKIGYFRSILSPDGESDGLVKAFENMVASPMGWTEGAGFQDDLGLRRKLTEDVAYRLMSENKPEDAFLALERGEAKGLNRYVERMILARPEAFPDPAVDEIVRLVKERKSLIGEMYKIGAGSADSASSKRKEDAQNILELNRKGLEGILTRLEEENPELYSLLTPAVAYPEEVQGFLNPTEGILRVAWIKDRLFLWLITRKGMDSRSVPLKPNHALLLSKPKWTPEDLAAISDLVFSGVREPMKGLTRLYLIPDDRTYAIPWERLPWNKGVLAREMETGYVFSLQHLLQSYSKRNINDFRLGLVSPQPVGFSSKGFPFMEIRNAEGKEATPAVFLGMEKQVGILHVASPFVPDAFNPLESYVNLSSPEQEYQWVTLGDLLKQRKSNFLLALSGSSLSNGRRVQDDVLTRLWLYAGYPTVLVDPATAGKGPSGPFFGRFYPSVRKTSIGAAFRDSFDPAAGSPGEDPRLFGYLGMNPEEKRAYAEENYLRLIKLGVSSFKEQNYGMTVDSLENALVLLESIGNPQYNKDIFRTLADAYFNLEDYPNGIRYEQRLVDFLSGGENPEELADAIFFLGVLYSRVEEYDKAAAQLSKSVSLYEENGFLDKVAKGYSTLGIVEENSSDYPQALQAFDVSLKINEEIGEVVGMGEELRRIGRIYFLRLNEYNKAKEYFEKAHELFLQAGEKRLVAQTLLELGMVEERLADFDEALGYYGEAEKLAGEINDSLGLTQVYINTADVYWFRGNYQEAFKYQKKALNTAKELNDQRQLIFCYNTLGLIYWTLNDPEKALFNLNRSLKIAEDIDSKVDVASGYNNIGLVYREKGDYEVSLQFFQKALDLDTALKSRWGIAYDHRNMGMSLFRLGKIPEAEESLQTAVTLSEETGDRTNLSKALVTLGEIHLQKGETDAALEVFNRAVQIGADRGIQEVVWRAKRGLGLTYLAKGDRDAALKQYREAVEVVEGMRASIKIEEFKNGFILNKQDLYEEIIQLLLNMGRDPEAFLYSERSRARSFIDLLGNSRINLKDEVDQKLYGQMVAMKKQIQEAEDGYRQAAEDKKKEAEANLVALRNRYADLLVEIKSESPQLTSFVTVEPVDMDSLFKLLGDQVAMVEYMVLKNEIVAWTLYRGKIQVTRVPEDRTDLEKKIHTFRKLIQDISPLADESRQLNDLIVTPVLPKIAGASYLAVVPHGVLHYLSFAALADDRGYLIEKYPLFFLPSASVFKYTVERRINVPKQKLRVLAFGNPDLGDLNYDLPLAELEAKAIPWDFPKSDVYTRKDATESRIWDSIKDYNVVHIASHGEFDPINPLFSSLKLAKDDKSDGNLEVNEIFSINMKTDLVTLSACQTGLGDVTGGDEVVGLNRAFIYAGTHSLISSLWRVSDLSTAILIKHFYRNYTKENKADSLRKAQLLVKSISPHPAYWAGFVLTGDYQ